MFFFKKELRLRVLSRLNVMVGLGDFRGLSNHNLWFCELESRTVNFRILFL